MILGIMACIALGLTVTMFATRQAMLGFACTMFWAIFGAFSYTESLIPWGDIEYYMFFAGFGMAIFTAYAAFGLREKKDTIADEEMNENRDEKNERSERVGFDDGFGPTEPVSRKKKEQK